MKISEFDLSEIKITAGKLLTLELITNEFGKVKVRETGQRLRERGLFPKGWASVEVKDIAILLLALSATHSISEVAKLKFIDKAWQQMSLCITSSLIHHCFVHVGKDGQIVTSIQACCILDPGWVYVFNKSFFDVLREVIKL